MTSSSTKTLKLKSSVDCFLNVLDLEPRDESEERTSVITTSRSNIMRDVSIQVTRKATSAAKSSRMKPVKQLNDKLSRRRTGASACGSSSPWRFESSAFQDVFRPERSDFNAYALPSTIALASGVTLSQGESKIEGPEPVKHTSTMSKKRFDVSACCLFTSLSVFRPLAHAANCCVASSTTSDRLSDSCGRAGVVCRPISTWVQSWLASVPHAFRAVQAGGRSSCRADPNADALVCFRLSTRDPTQCWSPLVRWLSQLNRLSRMLYVAPVCVALDSIAASAIKQGKPITIPKRATRCATGSGSST